MITVKFNDKIILTDNLNRVKWELSTDIGFNRKEEGYYFNQPEYYFRHPLATIAYFMVGNYFEIEIELDKVILYDCRLITKDYLFSCKMARMTSFNEC